MALDIKEFVTGVVSVVIAVILIVLLAVPIIQDNLLATSGDNVLPNAASINSILTIIPIMLVIAVLVGIVGLFIKNRN